MARALTYAGLLLLLWPLGAAGSSSASDDAFQVIVHPNNPMLVLKREFVRSAFLNATFRWPNGGHSVNPIDLPRDLPARTRFTRDILGKTPAQLRSFWVQRIFSGTALPPPEADSPVNTVAYVLAHPGGIGYVPMGADIGAAKRVRVE
jgi:hypothetical protein